MVQDLCGCHIPSNKKVLLMKPTEDPISSAALCAVSWHWGKGQRFLSQTYSEPANHQLWKCFAPSPKNKCSFVKFHIVYLLITYPFLISTFQDGSTVTLLHHWQDLCSQKNGSPGSKPLCMSTWCCNVDLPAPIL